MTNLSILNNLNQNNLNDELLGEALGSSFSNFKNQLKEHYLSSYSWLNWATSILRSSDSLSNLAICYSEINLPQTISPEDMGEVKVIVRNKSEDSFTSPLRINLYASTDATLDSKDERLGTLLSSSLTLQPGQAKTLANYAVANFLKRTHTT